MLGAAAAVANNTIEKIEVLPKFLSDRLTVAPTFTSVDVVVAFARSVIVPVVADLTGAAVSETVTVPVTAPMVAVKLKVPSDATVPAGLESAVRVAPPAVMLTSEPGVRPPPETVTLSPALAEVGLRFANVATV